jgi:DNA-binding response OmpR family regulator
MIEDDPAMRRATCRALAAAGHAVGAYENGRGAIKDIRREPPDLLLPDIFMPEMEGLETIREARALQPAMPIVAMSGLSFDTGDYLRIAEKFGAVASLRKPFRPAELLALVSRLLGESARPV